MKGPHLQEPRFAAGKKSRSLQAPVTASDNRDRQGLSRNGSTKTQPAPFTAEVKAQKQTRISGTRITLSRTCLTQGRVVHLQPRGRVSAWDRGPRRWSTPLIHRCHDYEVTFSPKCFHSPQPALTWPVWSAVDVRRAAKRSSAPTPVPGQPGPRGLHSASLSRPGSHCKQVSSPGSTYCRVFYASLCFGW